ncbi:MAG: TCR/Tet family MFS transporter [Hyphomicrobiaceae bacterium]
MQKEPEEPSEDGHRCGRQTGHATFFVFVTVCFDAIGFGIIIPVLPDLIGELADLGLGGAALWGGWLSFSYALMQFAFGPVVGNLSDRFGRRPILLASLVVLTIDYLIMAMAPNLFTLFVGRTIAGIAAATYSTCNAYVADVSSPEDRAKNFGLLGAGFGLGFILGPLIGGGAAEFGTRAPFYAAAVVAFVNFCYGLLVLPESLPRERRRTFKWRRANPLGAIRQIRKIPMVSWFVVTYFLFDVAHFVYPVIWAYYTKEAFGWSSSEVGLSLAIVGVGFVVVQGWLIRIILPRVGNVRTTIAGILINIVGFIGLAFATQGWMIYALMPVVALGAIVSPALTAIMSNRVPDDSQGELQGTITSVTAVTLVVSPILMTQLFGLFAGPDAPIYLPGAPFIAAAVITAMALLPFMTGLRLQRKSAFPTD